MRPIRYVGRHRNAGHGYPLWARLRREAAYFVSMRWGWYRLGYLIDFDRDRYLEEYAGCFLEGEEEEGEELWAYGVQDEEEEAIEPLRVKRT